LTTVPHRHKVLMEQNQKVHHNLLVKHNHWCAALMTKNIQNCPWYLPKLALDISETVQPMQLESNHLHAHPMTRSVPFYVLLSETWLSPAFRLL